MRLTLSNLLSFCILLISVSSIQSMTILPLGNTFIWWTLYAFILIIFVKSRKIYYDTSNAKNILFLQVYLVWNIICILRGVFVAENYWEWKNLVGTAMVLLLPLSIYISTNPLIVQKLLRVWINLALPAFFLVLPFLRGDGAGRYLVPISFLLLFLPFLTKKWKLIVLALTLVVVLGGLGARSNVIKYSLSFIFGLLLIFKGLMIYKFISIFRKLFLILPLVLFALAANGFFNIFQMDEYVSGSYKTTVVANGEVSEESLTADTRTALYEEVIFSAFNNNYYILGRTPARGNDSELFGGILEDLKTDKSERFANEASILNIFTWTGIVGVVLYFLIFLRSTYLAVYRSNNRAVKIIGLYLSFRWTYAWVEDFSNFDLSYFFLWIMIGLCFSNSFRSMNDTEVKYWVRGIFDKRYR